MCARAPVKHVTEEEESHTDTGLFENFAPLETNASREMKLKHVLRHDMDRRGKGIGGRVSSLWI